MFVSRRSLHTKMGGSKEQCGNSSSIGWSSKRMLSLHLGPLYVGILFPGQAFVTAACTWLHPNKREHIHRKLIRTRDVWTQLRGGRIELY